MAYFPKKTQQDELASMNSLGPTSQAQNTVQQNQNQVAGQAPVGGTSASSGSPEQAASPKSTKSSGMGADVRKYVNQNQPQNIAAGVEKATDSQAQAVGQQVQKQQSQFTNQVNQQRSMQEQAYQKAQQSLQAAQNLGADGTLDDASVKQYQSAAQMQSTAPQLDLTAAQSQSQRLANTAQQATTGRKSELLRQAFTGQGQAYSGGQSALDELILGGDTQAGERLVSQAQQAAKDQQVNITQARKDALAQTGGLQQQAADYRTGLTSGVDTAQDALKAALEGKYSSIQQLKEGGDLTPELTQQLKDIGLTLPELYGKAQTFGMDLGSLASGDLGAVATAEDLARARALAQLEQSQQDIILDPNRVGTAFDPEVQAQLNEKFDAYNSGISAQQAPIDRFMELLTSANPNLYTGSLNDTAEQRAAIIGQGNRLYEGQNITQSLLKPTLDALRSQYQTRSDYGVQGYSPSDVERLLKIASSNLSGYWAPKVGDTSFIAANGGVKSTKSSLLKKLMEKK